MKAKILLYDLEITPTLGYTYGIYDTNVIKVLREPYIMCFSYKWLGDRYTSAISQTDFQLYKKEPHNDKMVVKALWKLLDQADIIIAHNANRFDNRVANERFLFYGLGPPSPARVIDTLQVARRYFKNNSNSLNALCEKLEIGSKTAAKHGDLWFDCISGCEKSWKKMIAYCKQDTALLEKLYFELRPFIANHPHINPTDKEFSCPVCGSKNIKYKGYRMTNVNTYHRVFCKDCHSWSRERITDIKQKPAYVK
jgi:hypothetical protein